MLKFQRETFDSMIDEAMPLLEKHWREIAHYQDIELDVDRESYSRMEAMDMLRVFTARNESGKLLGYAAYFVKHNLHYKKSKQASQDVIYIDREHRGFGSEFILWCDEQLKLDNVQAVYHHVKKQHNWGHMLERMGYQLVDLIYTRRLD